VNAFVGQPLERLEDDRLLRGKATFVDDLVFDGMVYFAVLRSPVAHGRIVRIDLTAAKAMPGVVAAFVGADFDSLPAIPLRLAPIEGVERFLQRPIAREKVRFVGEPIAVIVADTPELAEDALELISVEIDALPAVVGWETASAPSALLFDEIGTNVSARYTVSEGDTAKAFAEAAYTRREVLYCHRHTALPMETRGLVAVWNEADGQLRIWGSTKVLWFNRRATADALGLQHDQVQLLGTDVGGGFGVRGELYPEDFLVPFVAKKLGRPVKWIEDRREHLMATNHSREITCDLEIACSREGMILGLRGIVYGDMGAYTRTNGGIVPARAAQFLVGPYRIPALQFDVAIFLSNKTPVGTYRGPGRFEANFFRERLMDLAANDLGIDAADFRRMNLIREDELPYTTGKLVPYEKPFIYDTGDYQAALERVLTEIDYERLRRLNGKEIDGRRHGVGLTCFVECSGGGPKENARLALEVDGAVSVFTGCSMIGQGLQTALTQLAADTMGIGMDRIHVHNASTEDLAEGFGTFASRGAIRGGNAVVNGARNFMEELMRFAAEVIGRATNDLHWQDGAIVSHDGTILFDLPALAQHAAARQRQIGADGSYFSTDLTFSYGAHAAYVAVDPRTGAVEVLDYVAVEDIGVAVNPLVVHGQLIGSIVQGLGGVFLDHLIYDEEGQFLTGTLADYLVPTATDFPVVRGESYGDKLASTNPLGVKGAGEGGIVGVAGAIANAVAAALRPLNASITALPLSPPRVWQAIVSAADQASKS
jgi:aerobic carbon-monoxide dehydrogenase large subunit